MHNGNIRIDGYSERFLTFSATLSINLDEKGNIHLVSALQQGIDLKELFSSFQWFFAAPDGTLFPSQEFITETCIYATPAGETVDKPDGVIYFSGQWDPNSRFKAIEDTDFDKIIWKIE